MPYKDREKQLRYVKNYNKQWYPKNQKRISKYRKKLRDLQHILHPTFCLQCHKPISFRTKSGMCLSCASKGKRIKNLKVLDKSFLEKWYNYHQKSIRWIEKKLKINGVLYWLKYWNIKRRTKSETNHNRHFTKQMKLKIGKSNRNPNLTKKDRIKRRLFPKRHFWIKEILNFFNYTCQICKNKGGKLVAHHLEGYHWCDKLRFNIFNGICLCEECHKKFHNIYGNKYNTTEQFIDYLIKETN